MLSAEAVNDVSKTVRDRNQCETRLRCFTSKVRTGEIFYKKSRKKTGGGPPVRIKLSESMLVLVQLAYIYMGNTPVEGEFTNKIFHIPLNYFIFTDNL